MALRANAAQTYLSYGWWLLEPFLYAAMFYLVFEVLLLRGTPGYFYFLIVGKIPFLWVSKCLSQGASSIERERRLVGSTPLPIVMFPYVSLCEAAYKQIVVFFVLVLLMTLGFGSAISGVWWWLVPVIVVNLLFIISLVLPFAWLVTVIPDVNKLIPIVSLFLMFMSGVFFDIRELGDPQVQELLMTYLPLAFILDAYRQILMYATPPDSQHLLTLFVVCLTFIFIVHVLFSRSQYFLASKVLVR